MSLIGRVGWDDKRQREGKNGECKIPLKTRGRHKIPLNFDTRLTVGCLKTGQLSPRGTYANN